MLQTSGMPTSSTFSNLMVPLLSPIPMAISMNPPTFGETISGRPLDSNSNTPLYRQLYDRLREAILLGGLAPGSKLPSTRACAEALGIARNTALNAYEQLLAEGYLMGRLGSGTFVSLSLPEEFLNAPAPRVRRTPEPPPPVSRRGAGLAAIPSPLSREQESIRAFRHGLPAVDEFPFDSWGRLTARIWRDRPAGLMSYGDPAGYRPLREAIAAYLGVSRGVKCGADRVIVVSGSQQALDLTARVLLDPGDGAWIEDPGYLGARGAFLAAGVKLFPAPIDGDGATLPPDEPMGRIRLAYVSPAHQYPLGGTMGMGRRLALLDWAKRANAWIAEDDYDSEFRYAGRPLAALQSIDAQGRVIYIGTFSKVLFPSIRLGYIDVPDSLVDLFVQAKTFASGHSPSVEQAVLAEFMSSGHFDRHVRRMRHLYADRQEVFLRASHRELTGRVEVRPSEAGMHLIAWLGPGVDDRAVSRRARERGIVITPLSSLAITPQKRGALVLGYTAIEPRAIRDGIRHLAGVLAGSS